MSALTLRLPDDKHARLKSLARRRGTSVNRLMEEMATVMIAEADAETRFALRASRGRGQEARGLALLRKADSLEPLAMIGLWSLGITGHTLILF